MQFWAKQIQGAKMNIGFVGMVLGENELKVKTCILKNANECRLNELIEHNLQWLDNVLDYLIKNEIKIFRLPSSFIPFGSHPANKIDWKNKYKTVFEKLGKKAKKHNIRLSMHPGQYTLLTTQNPDILERSIADLVYHCQVLDSLKMPPSCKIVLHIGGIYGDKESAIKRFVQNFKTLPINIKQRMILENDDTSYTAKDVLWISKQTKSPVVFDYLHFLLKHDESEKDAKKVILECRKTWKKRDGVQKIHYSQQAENKRLGSHSQTIDIDQFEEFAKILPKPIDVMFEVKDKNLSVLKWNEKVENLNLY